MRRLIPLTRYVRAIIVGVVLIGGGLAGPKLSSAETGVADVRITAHNLSKTGTGERKATTETQVCVFCHTPHGANTTTPGPLWNRSTPVQTYTRYTSSSLDANNIVKGFSDQPGGTSILCLSCHDGTVAVGNVNNAPGAGGAGTIATSDDGLMPSGLGANTGFTRRLGTDLTNDHPISITYNHSLAAADGQLVDLTAAQKDIETGGTVIAPRSAIGTKPLLPLERTGPLGAGFQKVAQMQCGTCHDPHLDKTKFLRLNRLQANLGPTGTFNQDNDIICLACHRKPGWKESAHADKGVADEAFTPAAGTLRGFPADTQVWQASCLSCHDTHTVQGSRRLLREGVSNATDSMSGSAGAFYQSGLASTSAIENTCYQCHRTANDGYNILTPSNGTVPNIKSEFERTYAMPIRTADQPGGGTERHNITTGDGIESDVNLGRNNTAARHAECPDCHNPHTIRRNSKFYGVNGDANSNKRTHDDPSAMTAAEAPFANVASGALRGAWGVEPIYTSSPALRAWPVAPDNFVVKKGDPGGNTSVATSATYLTREYQLCFKCHSNYANGDSAASYPLLGGGKGTLFGTNAMQRYTNVAAEFAGVNAGVNANGLALTGTDQGEVANPNKEGAWLMAYATTNQGTACGGGDCAPLGSVGYTGESMTKTSATYSIGPPVINAGNQYNHRSWHPVMYPTGRDAAERSITRTTQTNFRAPWLSNLGRQTMYCSDCHGQTTGVYHNPYDNPGVYALTPAATQGPHGSDNPFLLKGPWSYGNSIHYAVEITGLCGLCHMDSISEGGSGFMGDHYIHPQMAGACMTCHIAVPHGWKNKAFLVNLRCIGSEIPGFPDGCTAVGHDGVWPAVTRGPYYNGARLRISKWMRSGTWSNGEGGCYNMHACTAAVSTDP